MKPKNLKCCLCKKEIEVVRGWKEGHNAQPLKDGRCCDECNSSKVIPARLKRIYEPKYGTKNQVMMEEKK